VQTKCVSRLPNLQRVSMSPRRPKSVVLSYSPDEEVINIQTIDAPAILGLDVSKLTYPVFLEEHKHNLDDEFARKLGASILTTLAISYPMLEPYIKITRSPTGD
jgi:hypothetical protein